MKRGNRNRVGDSNGRGGRHLADNARAELDHSGKWGWPDCRLQQMDDREIWTTVGFVPDVACGASLQIQGRLSFELGVQSELSCLERVCLLLTDYGLAAIINRISNQFPCTVPHVHCISVSFLISTSSCPWPMLLPLDYPYPCTWKSWNHPRTDS